MSVSQINYLQVKGPPLYLVPKTLNLELCFVCAVVKELLPFTIVIYACSNLYVSSFVNASVLQDQLDLKISDIIYYY